MLRVLWLATKGNRLTPWRSPYLRWRIETYWGIPAESITPGVFWKFVITHGRDLARYLRWADRMAQG